MRSFAPCFLLALALAGMPIGGSAEIPTEIATEIDLATVKTLTVEQAREIVAKNDGKGLNLRSLTGISPDVAAELAKAQGDLRLNGLKELPPDVAEAFTPFAGHLHLEGLEEISPEAAAALGRRKGVGHLYLNGLKTLPPAVAKGLAVYRGGLYLTRVGLLSDEAAAELESYRGYGLWLYSLTDISEKGMMSLARGAGGGLGVAVSTVSDEAASVIAQRRGAMKLLGLKTLSDTAAASLAKHGPLLRLSLSKKTVMSAEASRMLREAGIAVPEGVPAAQGQVRPK